jgi:quinoprotein glucose dehydrogenase
MNAIDLNKGEIKWQVPFGEYKELRRRCSNRSRKLWRTGRDCGGLVFIAASRDEKSTFDKETRQNSLGI